MRSTRRSGKLPGRYRNDNDSDDDVLKVTTSASAKSTTTNKKSHPYPSPFASKKKNAAKTIRAIRCRVGASTNKDDPEEQDDENEEEDGRDTYETMASPPPPSAATSRTSGRIRIKLHRNDLSIKQQVSMNSPSTKTKNTTSSSSYSATKNNMNKRKSSSSNYHSSREALFGEGDVVEVLYDVDDDNDDDDIEPDWYEATILKAKVYHDDIRYDVHYTVDDAIQSNVSEENIRLPLTKIDTAKKKKTNGMTAATLMAEESPSSSAKKKNSSTKKQKHVKKTAKGYSLTGKSEFSEREKDAMEKLASYLEERGGERKQSKQFTCKVHRRPEGRYESIFYNIESSKRFKSMADVARSFHLPTTIPVQSCNKWGASNDDDDDDGDSDGVSLNVSPPPKKRAKVAGTTNNMSIMDPLIQSMALSQREEEAMEKLAIYLEERGGTRRQSETFTCRAMQRPSGRYESIFYSAENKRFKSMADVARSLDLSTVPLSGIFGGRGGGSLVRELSSAKATATTKLEVSIAEDVTSNNNNNNDDNNISSVLVGHTVKVRVKMNDFASECDKEEKDPLYAKLDTIVNPTSYKEEGRDDEGTMKKEETSVTKDGEDDATMVDNVRRPVETVGQTDLLESVGKLETSATKDGEDDARMANNDEGPPLENVGQADLLETIGKFSHGRPVVALNPSLNGEPKKPKNPPNSFALFCADAKNIMPELLEGLGGPGMMSQRTKVIANRWNAMDDAGKKKYKDLQAVAKEKHIQLLQQYKQDMETFELSNPGVITSAAMAKEENYAKKAAAKETASFESSPANFPPLATPEEMSMLKSQLKGTYCVDELCSKYRQSGCGGYCLTHCHLADPDALSHEQAQAEYNINKRFFKNKSNLCKWPDCIKYIQSNCHGYCLTHVKYADYMGEGEGEDGDGWLDDEGEDLLYEVTKVRVRLDNRLQNGFCKAILPQELRDEWGFLHFGGDEMDEEGGDDLGAVTGGECVGEDLVSDGERKPVCLKVEEQEEDNIDEKKDEYEPAASDTAGIVPAAPNTKNEIVTIADDTVPKPSKINYSDDLLDFAVSARSMKKSNGALKCRAISCDKNCQGNSDGFCRAHHNQYLICTGQCESWECICGYKVPDIMARCGTCHRWRDGKHPLESSYTAAKKAKNDILSDEIMYVDDNGEPWKCDCGNRVPAYKSRCGHCHHWKGGKRQGGWKLGSMGRDYDSDDGVDRTQDWECCSVTIPAHQTRCGKCNGWRGGKRIAGGAAAAMGNLPPWLCAKCHISNPGSRRRCGGCLTWRNAPSQTAAAAVMQSLKSTTKLSSNPRTSVGFVESSLVEIGLVVAPVDEWKCKKCNFGNFSSVLECSNCGESRPNYQWHKKQQDLQAEGTAAAVVVTSPTTQPPSQTAASSAISVAGIGISIQKPPFASISGPPDDRNYYGTFNEDLGYPEISIHFDFNRAYYHNHNYTYLNKSIVRSSGDSSNTNGED